LVKKTNPKQQKRKGGGGVKVQKKRGAEPEKKKPHHYPGVRETRHPPNKTNPTPPKSRGFLKICRKGAKLQLFGASKQTKKKKKGRGNKK